MTVQNVPPEKRYAANGVSLSYTIPFLLIEAGDLDVFLNGVEVTSGFTLTGVGNPTSTITFTVAPLGDLYLVLNVPFQRLVDYQENGDFLAKTVNRDFDRIWQALKQLFLYSTRSLKLGTNDVDGAGAYRAKGNLISDLKDPVSDQDATTMHWSRVYITALISAIQGPINNALNIFYKGPDNLNYVVQDMSSVSDPAKGFRLIGNALGKGEVLDPNGTAPGTSVSRGYGFGYYPEKAGAIRIGGSDTAPTNDERNYWRGLPSPNAWGNPVNIGLYSAAFNRNGASYGTYSSTFGHDCVTYGTTSIAGGAGSCTGNPDTPDDLFTGYCAIAWGKNVLAAGEKSAGFGEEHILNTRAAMGFGYNVKAQPSVTTPSSVGSAGMGRDITLQGQAAAVGSYLNAADGVLIGTGINPGTPMTSFADDEVAMGSGANIGAIRVARSGTVGVRSRLGINNFRALNNEIDIDVTPSSRLGITIDGTGQGKIALMGLKSDGTEQELVTLLWFNPNLGTPLGQFAIRMNGRSANAFIIDATGSIGMEEIKTAATVTGSPAGTIYRDAGVLKIV